MDILRRKYWKKMKIYVDIDDTICSHGVPRSYPDAQPIVENIEKINKLYDEGHEIIYWTARGGNTGLDWTELTTAQLEQWGAKHHLLIMNEKPSYDLLICDKTKRIEEL
jgi:hypothetical protein